MTDILWKLDTIKGTPSSAFLVSVIKEIRKSKVRRPDIIVRYASQLVSASNSQDVWNVYEQIVQAALDVGDIELASTYLLKLRTKFPKSGRVQRLIAMRHEALGEYENAVEIYDKLVSENPGNILAMKRKAAVKRAQGQLTEAVTVLHEIIKLWPADAGVWVELCDIHLSQGDIASAAFCMEELVLMEPVSAPAHARLADCYYSLGGHANAVKSRKHYALSLDLQEPKSNLRALYGLIKACRAVASESAAAGSSSQTPDKADALVNAELGKWAKEQIASIAASAGGDSSIGAMLHTWQ